MKYFLLVFLFAFGCSAAMKKSKDQPKESTDLKIIVMHYHQHMRWGLWEKASMYMEEAARHKFIGRFEELGEDYKITDLEIKQVLRPESELATVEVEQQWYHEPNMTVQKDRFMEVWKLGSDGWRLSERTPKKEYRRKKKEAADKAKKLAEEKAMAEAEKATTDEAEKEISDPSDEISTP